MSQRPARPTAEQTLPAQPAQPMRLLPALVILALLVVVASGAGAALEWSAHPPAAGSLAGCATQAQLAPGAYAGPPPMCIDVHKKYTGRMVTTKGTMSFSFLTGSTPKTVNNFVVLASHGFFNGLKFFNPQTWAIQSGDPLNSGHGGAGYNLPQEPPREQDQWLPGSLGMARYANGSISGSQFFILRDAWPGGDPTEVYNHFATITSGFDVASQLGPTDRILSVNIKES